MTQLVITGAIELLMIPVLVMVLKRIVGRKLDQFDEKRDEARMAQAAAERKAVEQREAERSIVLAIARTMLLDNYEKCVEKGCYTIEERDVYGALFASYESDGGNGVIKDLAPRIRALPIEPPEQGKGIER